MTLGKVSYAWGLCRVPRDEILEQKTGVYPFFEGGMRLRPMFMRVR